MFKRYFAMTSLVILTACSGSNDMQTSQVANVPGGSTTPGAGSGTSLSPSTNNNSRIISNEDFSPGIMGIDADKNGIRDDVDRLITQNYSNTPTLKRSAEQKARALQQFMEASTKPEVLAAGDEIRRAGACVFKVLPEKTKEQEVVRDRMSKEIEALTANSKERFIKYWDSNKMAGGAVFEQPTEPVCD